MAQRTCDTEGCEEKHLARGMCGVHYRAWFRANKRDRRAEYYDVTCVMCGEAFRSSRKTGKYCDDDCRALHYMERDIRPASRGVRRPRVCPLPDDHPVMMICPLEFKWCCHCGQKYACRPARSRQYSTARCKWRAKGKRKSRRHLSRKTEIFQRDGYICWICDKPTSRSYAMGDIWSPTIDHLVPQSLGGTDDPDNLATAHMWCNSARGASWDVVRAA